MSDSHDLDKPLSVRVLAAATHPPVVALAAFEIIGLSLFCCMCSDLSNEVGPDTSFRCGTVICEGQSFFFPAPGCRLKRERGGTRTSPPPSALEAMEATFSEKR